ncbi:hypothetical protein QJS10_CPA01g02681 [Acorus calamus]|uniref:Ubiquitin-like domain-containing protein n=1 Tax=Acorus calamus TaxID=4465 RepID=A0AAV9FGR1_ACOCL|nr:hypothetical protein QJS10_CPA01g02681 [Acorus calamus]
MTNRTWTGWPIETLTGEYPTVGGLKRELHRASGILHRRQLLVHDGKLMHDDATHPSHYGVGDGASIDLHLKLPMRESVTFRIEYHDTTISMASRATQ